MDVDQNIHRQVVRAAMKPPMMGPVNLVSKKASWEDRLVLSEMRQENSPTAAPSKGMSMYIPRERPRCSGL